VTLIKEPEAAALYTLHVLQDRALAVGDALVICDAGGGTVDLISYEITKLAPKLELKELVPGKGMPFPPDSPTFDIHRAYNRFRWNGRFSWPQSTFRSGSKGISWGGPIFPFTKNQGFRTSDEAI
jgi:hypothetical protein